MIPKIWDRSRTSRRALRPALAALFSLAIVFIAVLPLLAQQISSYKRKASVPQSASQIRKRAEWFFRPRATQNGHIPAGLLARAFAQNQQMIASNGTFIRKRLGEKADAISAQLNAWTPLGPQPTSSPFYGNVSGRVTSLAADPCDVTGNTLYAGAADGGLWVSFNAINGNPPTWQPLTDNQPSLSTGAIVLNASSCGSFNSHLQSKLIVAGTGESNFAQDNIYGAGVLYSTNGGQTWAQDATFTAAASQGEYASGPYIGALAIQPNSLNPVLLAAVQGTDYSAGGSLPSGVYRSADGGAHWSRVQPQSASASGAPFSPATDVIFDSGDLTGNTAYAALGDPRGDVDPKASCSSAPCNGVYISTDAGQSWSRVTGVDASASESSYGRISLAMAPGTSPAVSKLFVSIADSTTNSDNLLTVLSGSGIQLNGSGPAFSVIFPNTSNLPDFCEPLCYYDMKLAVVPGTNGSVVFAGGSAQPHLTGAAYGNSSVYRSADGGNSWDDFSADGSGNDTFTHVDVHAFDFALGAGAQILGMFVGNDGGVYASPDAFNSAVPTGSQHWTSLSANTGNPNASLNITQFYPGISLHPATDQIIYGGTQGNDVQEFGGSLTWSAAEACPYDGGYTAIDQQNPSTVYASCSYLGGPGTLNKNTQNGAPGSDGINWVAIDFSNGIDFADNADFIPPFVIDSTNSQNLYFGTFRLYQTTNAGANWSAISNDLTTDGSRNYITTIQVAPSDSNTVYVGASDGLIWKTSQALSGAADIHKVNQTNQPSRQVAALAIDPLVPQSAFASYSGFSCPGVSGCDGLGHLFFTSNSGAAWTKADGNLPDVPVNDIVIDPNDSSDNTVYIATDSGVYATSNATSAAGATWSVLQSGLPNSQVLSLKLRNSSRTLVAATHGRGMWSIKLPAPAVISLTSLNPVSANAGDASFTLTAAGTGFTAQSTINFNGSPLPTTFISATSLTAMVPSTDISCAGPLFVSVTDPVEGSTNALRFTVGGGCDFSFGASTPSSVTVTPGSTATYQLSLTTTGSLGNAVQLSCMNPPAGITCQFNPNPATPAQGGTPVALTLSVPATALVPTRPRNSPSTLQLARTLEIFAIVFLAVLIVVRANRRISPRRLQIVFSTAIAVILLALLAACGGSSGGGAGPKPQTYTITVQGVSQNFQHLTTVQLVVD